MPDRGEDVLEPVTLVPVVVDISRGHDGDLHPVREAGEPAGALSVSAHPVVLELDEEVVRAEGVHESVEESLPCGVRVLESVEEGASPAPRQEDQPLGPFEEEVEGEGGRAPWAPAVRFGEKSGEVRVSLGRFREKSQMEEIGRFIGARGGGGNRAMTGVNSRGVGFPGKSTLAYSDLGAGDRLDPLIVCGTCEFHRSIKPVVVGEGERGVRQLLRPEDELFRV
jgi:hypothetical protein